MNLYNAKSTNDFYSIIKTHYKQYDMQIINTNQELENIKRHLLQEMPNTKFLDYSFVISFIQKCKYYYIIYCSNCIFHIVSRTRPDLQDICLNINNTVLIKHLYNIQKSLEFFIVMNPVKRMFPKKGCMQARHINGGFTNPKSNQIYIIRKQEYSKVMIHELLHHNNNIHNDNWDPLIIERLKDHFKIAKHCKFYPNEAVIETTACMIYVCLRAINYRINFVQLLQKEKNHICILANKIIRMQNGKNWYEETNSFCYIVLRCILFCHFRKFLQIYNNPKLLAEFLIMKKIPKYTQNIKQLNLLG